MPRLLFIDAYDSFAQNINALLHQCVKDAEITNIKIDSFSNGNTEQKPALRDDESIVIGDQSRGAGLSEYQNDDYSIEQFLPQYDAIILGPGPGNPQNEEDVGLFTHVWRIASIYNIPVLGICLGFQSLCLQHGIPVSRMHQPCHGLTKEIRSNEQNIFRYVSKIEAINYNSLAVHSSSFAVSDKHSRPSSSGSDRSFNSISSASSNSVMLPHRNDLDLLAWDDDGYAMAVKHTRLPFWGLQFHPESCKSNNSCIELVQNWWYEAVKHNETYRRAQADDFERFQSHLENTVPFRRHSFPTSSAETVSEISPTASTPPWFHPMMHLTCNTADEVQWARIKVETTPEEIANLCYTMSPQGKTAMLNSTRKGRFCIYAMTEDALLLEYAADNVVIRSNEGKDIATNVTKAEVLYCVEELIQQRKAVGGPEYVPFWGGFIGYFSYEFGLDMIDIETKTRNSRQIPDISLLWVDRSIVFDHETSTIYAQSIRKDDNAWITQTINKFKDLEDLQDQNSYLHDQDKLDNVLASASTALPDHQDYVQQIIQCQEELRAGNSYELCLTTEAQIETIIGDHHPFLLYKNMHKFNPVPFGAYFDLNEVTILGTSPEQYLSWSRKGIIDMIPMKGTVKRTPDMTFARATDILSTPKESAENLMIADLIRHDLYTTVGATSHVEIVKLCEVVEHETVYQLVSHLRAHAPIDHSLDNDKVTKTAIHYGHKALRSTVPPGSMTGAPKKRSCEILSALEDRNRGVYSGVLGFFDIGGGGSWNVCIRSAFSSAKENKNGRQTWHVGAGGAITVLSDPEAEWEEMSTKLDSVLRGFAK